MLDEISWMGSKDPTFIPKLKVWWDIHLQNYPNLTLILCGSVSTWIEKNILKSTSLFGRISLQIDLDELSLANSYKLLRSIGVSYSDYDTLKILSITGGVPWYLEQIDPHKTADENIRNLCFESEGIFVHEFDRIFHDLFTSRNPIYQEIVQKLASGMKTLRQLRQDLDFAHSGSFGEHLSVLRISGYVTQHPHWSLKTGKMG